jgi:ATP-binding cassette subfamily B protein
METYPKMEYDLTPDMSHCTGMVQMGDGALLLTRDGQELPPIDTARIKELAVLPQVGCGVLYAVFEDDDPKTPDMILCRFSMRFIKQAGEFSKIYNYARETGTVKDMKHESRACDTCGRALPEGVDFCMFCMKKSAIAARLLKIMGKDRKAVLITGLVMALTTSLWLAVPIINRYLIDEHLRPMTGTAGTIIGIAALMFAVRALHEVIFIFNARYFNRVAAGFANRLRNLVFDKLQSFSMAALQKRTSGDLMRRVVQDTQRVREFLVDYGRWAIEQSITMAIVFTIMMVTNWRLALLVFVPVPIAMFVLTRFWRFIFLRYERQWRAETRANSILHDIIKGIRVVKAFGNEKREIAKFEKISRELADVSSDNEKTWAKLFPVVIFFAGIGEFLVLYFAGQAVLQQSFTLGELVMFTTYITMVYGPLRWFVMFPRWFANAMTSVAKLFEILDEPVDIPEAEAPEEPDIKGAIAVDNLTFGYKSYEPVLKGLTLDIAAGEMVGLVGKSGVGKSTMIALIMRLYDPDMGAIRIDGVDLRDMSLQFLHENIGVVFQDTYLFAGSIYDNIAYAKPGASLDEIIAAAMAAHAHEFIVKLADGYSTEVGENGYNLSGGERQRIAIARAILKDPVILILDEATSSLDVETEGLIQESLARLTKGRTTIAIAHRLSTLKNANRLAVLDKGTLAELGTHRELLEKRGIYYDLVMAQRQAGKTK